MTGPVGRLSAEAPVSVWALTRTAQPGAPSNSLPEHEGFELLVEDVHGLVEGGLGRRDRGGHGRGGERAEGEGGDGGAGDEGLEGLALGLGDEGLLGVSQEFRGNGHEASSESTPTRQARVYIALHASQSSPRRIARLTGAVAMAGPADEPEQNKLKRVALSKPKFNVDRIKIN